MTLKSTLTKIFMCLLLFTFGTNTNAQVFWSEDFTDGIPATWEVTDATGANGALWMETTIGPTGPFAGNTGPLHAAGSGETWIIYDSDADCSGNQHAWIISDAIDCTDKMEVWMDFDQAYQDFFCETYIRVSTDNTLPLDQWGTAEVNPLEPNDFGADHVTVDLSDLAALEPVVYVAFEFRNLASQAPAGLGGCAYNWQVDNITLTDINPTPQLDMTISFDFFARAPYAQWPISQVENFGFIADVANIGQATQTGVELNITILDEGTGSIAYNDVLDTYGTMAPGDTIENQLFPGDGFTPPSVTTYRGEYEITSDSMDADPANNLAVFNFATTNNDFAKDIIATTGITPAGFNPGEPHTWAFGNHYYFPNGDGWFADKVKFSVVVNLPASAAIVGNNITLFLYEWTDVVLGGPGEQTVITSQQRQKVGFASYTIAGGENGSSLIELDLFDINSGQVGVALKNDAHYVIMLEYTAPDEEDLFVAADDDVDYGAQILRAEELGLARYASILVISDIENGDFGTAGFIGSPVPVVRLGITDVSIATSSVLSPENIVDVFPSPAQDYVNVNLEMVEQQSEVTLQLVDVSGKIVQQRQLQDVKAEQVQLKLDNLPVGSYFLNVNTATGQRSVPLMIQR